jgi:hypothetical protein
MRLLFDPLGSRASSSPNPLVRGLELGDVEFAHLQHPPHHLTGSLPVGISQQLRQLRRHHLP